MQKSEIYAKEISKTIKQLDKAKSLEFLYVQLSELEFKKWSELPINFDNNSIYESKELYKSAKELLKKSNYHRKRVIDLEYKLKTFED